MSESVETIRRVYDDTEGTFIEVGPDRDGVGHVTITVPDEESKKYFGKADLQMTKSFAKLLGQSLIAASEEKD